MSPSLECQTAKGAKSDSLGHRADSLRPTLPVTGKRKSSLNHLVYCWKGRFFYSQNVRGVNATQCGDWRQGGALKAVGGSEWIVRTSRRVTGKFTEGVHDTKLEREIGSIASCLKRRFSIERCKFLMTLLGYRYNPTRVQHLRYFCRYLCQYFSKRQFKVVKGIKG